MQPYIREATRATPFIRLDPDAGRLEISGSSYPENASSLYQPMFDMLERMLLSLERPLIVDLEMIYLNSSSSKVFMMLLDRLEQAAAAGATVHVTWRYDLDNESALEIGQEFMEDLQHAGFTLEPTGM